MKYIEEKIENDRMIQVYKKYLDVTEYIVSHILYFSLKHQMQNIKSIMTEFKIDSGTRVLELDTKTSTFYLTPELYIHIPVKTTTYTVLANFDNPINILFNRCEIFVDDLIYTFTGTKSDYFNLDYKKVKSIIKNKIHHEKNLLVEVITKWLTFGDAKKYEKHIKKYLKVLDNVKPDKADKTSGTVSIKSEKPKAVEPKSAKPALLVELKSSEDSGIDSGSGSESDDPVADYNKVMRKFDNKFQYSEEEYKKFGKYARKAYEILKKEYLLTRKYSELPIDQQEPIKKRYVELAYILENIENNFKIYL
jgi:hypothetical protein